MSSSVGLVKKISRGVIVCDEKLVQNSIGDEALTFLQKRIVQQRERIRLDSYLLFKSFKRHGSKVPRIGIGPSLICQKEGRFVRLCIRLPRVKTTDSKESLSASPRFDDLFDQLQDRIYSKIDLTIRISTSLEYETKNIQKDGILNSAFIGHYEFQVMPIRTDKRTLPVSWTSWNRRHTCGPDQIRVIKDWASQRPPTAIANFIGLLANYRRFIKGFSKIAKSMTKLTQKGIKFDWGEKEENAFQLIIAEAAMEKDRDKSATADRRRKRWSFDLGRLCSGLTWKGVVRFGMRGKAEPEITSDLSKVLGKVESPAVRGIHVTTSSCLWKSPLKSCNGRSKIEAKPDISLVKVRWTLAGP
ncbi:hypothetical protein Tco_0307980 [Tanacetum coccineum]